MNCIFWSFWSKAFRIKDKTCCVPDIDIIVAPSSIKRYFLSCVLCTWRRFESWITFVLLPLGFMLRVNQKDNIWVVFQQTAAEWCNFLTSVCKPVIMTIMAGKTVRWTQTLSDFPAIKHQATKQVDSYPRISSGAQSEKLIGFFWQKRTVRPICKIPKKDMKNKITLLRTGIEINLIWGLACEA